jgi:hypothetical protein
LKKKNLVLLAAVIASALSTSTTPASADEPVDRGCTLGKVCVYKHTNFSKPVLNIMGDVSNFKDRVYDGQAGSVVSVNDTISSVYNRSSATLVLYADTHYNGKSIQIAPFERIEDLRTRGMNDTASSLQYLKR